MCLVEHKTMMENLTDVQTTGKSSLMIRVCE